MVLTDPPWGVNLFDIQEVEVLPKYDDTQEKAFDTLKEVLPEIKRVMKVNSHAYFSLVQSILILPLIFFLSSLRFNLSLLFG